MAKRFAFWISFCFFLFNDISLVLTADECNTRNDCKDYFWWKRSCCRHTSGEKRCQFSTCDYCISDNDCVDSSECCRSNKCVKSGCSGCTKNKDCHYFHSCCKKTYPFSQTFCASNCINASCNSHEDCGGLFECCRSGRCAIRGCDDTCTSNSECDSGKYCCKKKFFGHGCQQSCVGEICSSDDDCGGPNECCIFNKCVTSGCSGCSSNRHCHTFHYCCKKTFPLSESFCASSCINAPCNSNDDCGGPYECCRSGKCVWKLSGCYKQCTSNSECDLGKYCCKKRTWPYGCRRSCVGESCSSHDDCGGPNECCISNRCVTSSCSGCNCDSVITTPSRKSSVNSKQRNSSHSSFPFWIIAIVVSVLFMLVFLALMVIWYFKPKRPANATRVIRGRINLQNTTDQGDAIQNPQPSTRSSDLSNSTQGIRFQFPPPSYESVGLENTRNHGTAIHNPQQMGQHSENPPPYSETDAFQNSHHQGNQVAMPSNPNQYDSEGRVIQSNLPEDFFNIPNPNGNQQDGSPPPYYPRGTTDNPL